MNIFVKSFSGIICFLIVINLTRCSDSVAKEIDVSPLPGIGTLEDMFLKHYQPAKEDFVINMPAYSLPLNFAKVSNFSDVANRYLQKGEHKSL